MGSVIFCTIVMVAVLGILYRALGAVGAARLQTPVILLIGAVTLLSTSMHLSQVPADILRVVVGTGLLAWMLYVFIASQIEPKRKSTVNLTDDQKKKIQDLAKEILAKEGSDFDVDKVVKPVEVHHPLDTDDMMPLSVGTKVSTPQGNGTIELFIPTLEMIHNSEEFRNVKGYCVRMDDNNIRYFRMSDVQEK